MKSLILSTLALTLALTACSDGGNSKKKDEAKTVITNGESPEDYFSHLVAYSDGICDERGVTYHYLLSEDVPGEPSTTNDGKPVVNSLEIYLNRDHTLKLYWQSRKIFNYLEDGYAFESLGETLDKGEWEVLPNGHLSIKVLQKNGRLYPIAEGVAIKYNGQRAVEIYIRNQQGRFKQKSVIFRMVESTTSHDEICHITTE